jgi:FAD/FMN-containing dehydrogenase
MSGFTLGGGYGALMGAYGLGADNLLAAEVVIADGRLITVSAEEHPELLWGLRGGGGNFGVVVALEYRLHPLTTVVSGLLLFPFEQARELLRGFDAFTATAPDTLTVQSGFLSAPDGSPMVYLTPTYCGPLEESEAALAPLRALGTPLADQVQPLSYHAFQHALDAYVPKGRHYYIQTRSLPGLGLAAIDTLIEQGLPLTSPFSIISLHNFHGAASRVESAATAFALRQSHFMVELIAGWEPSPADDDQRHVQWARRLSQALAPFAIDGGYINLLDVDEQPRVPLAFGPNYERLRALKRAYDPEDIFSSTVGHLAS